MKKNKFVLALTSGLLLASVGAQASERVTYAAEKTQRGTTISIPEHVINNLCGDGDGCTLRLGMSDWDTTYRTASRESLFYYNRYNRQWRAESGDRAGHNDDNVTQHVMHAWACYFTDGDYSQWTNHNDSNTNFGLLSWNQYNARCVLTIID